MGIADITEALFAPLLSYYKYLGFNKTLAVKSVTKDGVYIFGKPAGKDKLFVIKLESQNNEYRGLNLTNLKKAVRHSEDSQLSYFFVKQGAYQMGYIATFSEQVAINLTDTTGLPICTPEETIHFLLDIFTINKYDVSASEYTITPTINVDKIDKNSLFDPLYYNFTTVLKDGAFSQNEKYKLYQAVKFTNKSDFTYTSNFKKKFNGIMAVYIDLSDIGTMFQIDSRVSYAKVRDRALVEDFELLAKENKLGGLNVASCNAIILCDDEREAQNTAGTLGFEIIEKKYDKLEIIRKTMLLTRELDYDKLLPLNYLSKIMGVRTRKNVTKKDLQAIKKPWTQVSVDFWGEDLYGGFANFCYRANENPHCVFIGDAGTGKSVAVQKILSSILRIDYDKEEIGRFRQTKTRYFEIGGSSAQMLKFIKQIYSDDIGIIKGTLDNMKFSVTDVRVTEDNGLVTLNSDSLKMCIYLVNIILKENNEEPLSASEQAIYGEYLKYLYEKKAYKIKTIAELRAISPEAYSEYIETFRAKGYRDSDRLNELKDVGDIENLLKPTVSDLISIVESKSMATQISDVDRNMHNSLILKLRAIKDVESGLYGALSSLKFNDKRFYSFEFNHIKEDPSLLRIVFSFLFTTVYEQDVKFAMEAKEKRKLMPQTMYIFEETRNFTDGNEELVKMLKKTIFEGRKYQIHAMFIAQNVEHVPEQFITGASTFMFLVPKGEEKRAALEKDIRRFFPNSSSVDYLLENIRPRTIGIISSSGVYGCTLKLTDKELELFAV